MKKIHILGLIVIAIAVGIIISTAGDASTYVTFSEAQTMASKGNNSSIHVVGQLTKNEKGEITNMIYRPEIDPNHFEFSLVDNAGVEKKVVYPDAKPQDFDKSEQVVVIGNMEDGYFHAEKILLKCPSKYENDKLEIKEYSAKPAV
ncbi:cytochrome c maturation protein CcmE [Ravibacter arvi]|uniref:Cytochrome c maturation protein CcmE n=1 Tax=Ravibacter arvi TaxID=2051041 RepID=A0ABP8LJW9_9BACT